MSSILPETLEIGPSQSGIELEFTKRILIAAGIEFAPDASYESLLQLYRTFGRRSVCQYQFRRSDIVWTCRTCQKDDTCVLCNTCFQNSCHEGHEVYFYHSNAAGCCDCGDECAWSPAGFCTQHSIASRSAGRMLPPSIENACVPVIESVIVDALAYFASYTANYLSCNSTSNIDLSNCEAILIHRQDRYGYNEIVTIFQRTIGSSRADSELIAKHLIKKGYFIFASENVGSRDALPLIASIFRRYGFNYCSLTREDLKMGNAVLTNIVWMSKLSLTSDDMCELIGLSFSSIVLRELFRVDSFLSIPMQKALHDLLVNLMSNKAFKGKTASAYACSYKLLAAVFGGGCGTAENSAYSISVQFLNRENFVTEMNRDHNFMLEICNAFNVVFEIAGYTDSSRKTFDLTHPIFENRRYYPIIADLKVMFTSPSVARLFLTSAVGEWLKILSKLQCLHKQKRMVDRHIEFEAREWASAFNVYLGLSSAFELMVAWLGDTRKLVGDKSSEETMVASSETSQPSTNGDLISAEEFLRAVWSHINSWQEETLVGATLLPVAISHDESHQLFSYPSTLSFHTFLHRFFASAIHECCNVRDLSSHLEVLRDMISTNQTGAKVMLDYCLMPLVFAAEIEAGYWIRNGSVMLEQLGNYANSPFCKNSRDLDILLTQFCGSMQSGELFVGTILHRFGVYQSLFGSSGQSGLFYSELCERTSEMNSVMTAAVMKLFANLLTDLPVDVDIGIVERVQIALRRELIHCLACGPNTYSALQDCSTKVPNYKLLPSAEVNLLISQISEGREAVGTDPPKRGLSSACWQEYDPCFLRMDSKHHQEALELRPQLKVSGPMVKPFIAAHRSFVHLRQNICCSQLFDDLIRTQVLLYAAKLLSANDNYASIRKLQLLTGSSHFSLALQLLTLAIHYFSAPCDPTDLMKFEFILSTASLPIMKNDLESNHFASEPAIDDQDRCKICRQEFGIFSGMRTCAECNGCVCSNHYVSSEHGLKRLWVAMSTSASSSILCTQCHSRGASQSHQDTVEMNSNAPTNYDPIAVPSLLCALWDIEEKLTNATDKTDLNNKLWIDWVLSQCSSLSVNCERYNAERSEKIRVAKKQSDLDSKRRKARERAMSAMQASAQAFADLNDEDLEDGDGAQASAIGGDSMHSESGGLPDCIVCRQNRTVGDNNDVLGFFCLVQHSTVFCEVSPRIRVELDPQSADPLVHPSTIVTFCGHAMHNDCFEQFRGSEALKGNQTIYLDVEKRQFLCPFCKTLGSSWLPCQEQLKPLNTIIIDPPSSQESISFSRNDWIPVAELVGEPVVDQPVEGRELWLRFLYEIGRTAESREGYSLSENDRYSIRKLGEAIASFACLAICNADEDADVSKKSSSQQYLSRLLHSIHSSIHSTLTGREILIEIVDDLMNLQTPHSLLPNLALAAGLLGQDSRNYFRLTEFARWTFFAYFTQITFDHCCQEGRHVGECLQMLISFGESTSELICRMLGYLTEPLIEIEGSSGNREPRDDIDAERILRDVLNSCNSFLKCIRIILGSTPAFQSLSQQNSFAMTSNDIINELGFELVNERHRNPRVMLTNHWIPNLLARKAVTGSHSVWPTFLPPTLMSLPKQYTVLHAAATDNCSFDNPGICLRCGAVLDADGKGHCTTHIAHCGAGTGAIFLVQDHNVLLFNGPHCCYYPSMYVDEHGETHKHFRGMPLTLDETKYSNLLKLWISHQIVTEVSRKRSTLARVVINGYY